MANRETGRTAYMSGRGSDERGVRVGELAERTFLGWPDQRALAELARILADTERGPGRGEYTDGWCVLRRGGALALAEDRWARLALRESLSAIVADGGPLGQLEAEAIDAAPVACAFLNWTPGTAGLRLAVQS